MKYHYTLSFSDVSMDDVPRVGGKNASLGEMMQALTKSSGGGRGIKLPDGFIVTADAYRYFIKENGLEKVIKEELRKLRVATRFPKRNDERSVSGTLEGEIDSKRSVSGTLEGEIDSERSVSGTLEGEIDSKRSVSGTARKNSLSVLAEVGKNIRTAIRNATFPEDLEREIRERYVVMEREYKKNVDVAVRSSATAEDLPGASFAGQQETYLNVRGARELMDAVRAAFASLFTDRAISYRADKGFAGADVALSVGVQNMVRSDRGASGVAFTVDTESGFEDVVLINGAFGLGELVVQGEVTPDEWVVFKPTWGLIDKRLGKKDKKLVYRTGTTSGLKATKLQKTSEKERANFSLSEDEVRKLAKWCVTIEQHYSERNGKWTPMDIEWAKDGISGELYIIQARPETVQSVKDYTKVKVYRLKKGNKRGEAKLASTSDGSSASFASSPILTGAAVGNKIATGKARVILDAKHIGEFREGEVLVTDMTDPDWEPIMKIASAIVTDKGGRTSHAAIVSRELGIPAIVGTGGATKKLKTGQIITVDTTGSEGNVYEGELEFEVLEKSVSGFGNHSSLRDSRTHSRPKVMMNIATPDTAFEKSFIPNDGVGLAREEFIIASEIGIHPNLLIEYERGTTGFPKRNGERLVSGTLALDSSQRSKLWKEVEKRTSGWKDKEQFYVDKLAYGIGKIAAAFYPKEVIVRFSDFKTNEYRTLLGGEYYEPEEQNPMLGWRGASRYYDQKFAAAFGLECRALGKVRDEMKLTNVVPMVPFCRTPEEGKKVVEIMEKYGLKRGERSGFPKRNDERSVSGTLEGEIDSKRSVSGTLEPSDSLRVYVMCEIPSNVVRADEFLDIFDGMSIGSNDLTQLTLGLDRDSELLAHVGDERDAAVRELVRQAIRACRKRQKYVGICGDAPSTFPEFKKFLIREGIESISLNPDAILDSLV